ncbi:MAG: hypothetical protein LBL18_03375 [Bacteroidales bacterium]|jgi:hypothetical protein|nr:hypothetical protein [Bacteroidales bacterium]
MNIRDVIENRYVLDVYRNLFTENADILEFTQLFFYYVTKQKFDTNWHHTVICDKLNEILTYQHPTNRIIINIPPRFSKTELAVVSLISYAYALNPTCEFMHFSSSSTLVTRNVTNIRNVMESELYKAMFPHTELSNDAKGSLTTSAGGVLYSAPFLGQITGFGCGKMLSDKFAGAMIIDDPMKTQDALSTTIRKKYNFTWANTLKSRLNDVRTPVIVIGQRVHEDDFCGFLIKEEGTIDNGGQWDVIKIPAITKDENGIERSTWERKISLKDLYEYKKLDNWVFETQQMQNPKPIEGLLFDESKTKYSDLPPREEWELVIQQIDPKGEGKDYFCSGIYIVSKGYVYIADYIFTQEDPEAAAIRALKQMKQWQPSYCYIESNGGWIIFARQIRAQAAIEAPDTKVQSFHSTENKELKIYNSAPFVNNRFIYLPHSRQTAEYKSAIKYKHSYLKLIKDQIDDSLDTDACVATMLQIRKII